MRRDVLDRLIAARRAAEPVALVTELGTGLQSLVYGEVVHGSLGLEPGDLALVRERLAADKSGVLDGRLFVHVVAPPPRLIIVGAVHIAQALAPMGALAGYAVTVIDPRRAWATGTRFPGVTVEQGWPDDAMAALKPDARTAVVTLTHDPKLDDPALVVACRSPAFYIGALGSRRTHAKRVDRLKEQGLAEVEIGRIHGPVGLRIAALSPAEIACSILAEITLVRRSGDEPKAQAA